MGADVTGEGRRYSASELVAAARAEQLPASKRLLRRWDQAGLLDRPTVRGLGRGRGVTATWSENQLQLFLVLARYSHTGASLAELCRVPVWLWLRWGDDYIPLRQVRCVLTTWLGARTSPSWSDSEKVASSVVSRVAEPGTRRAVKARLRQTIASQAFGGFERDAMREAARDAIDGSEQAHDPGRRSFSGAGYAELVAFRMVATDHFDALADEDFELARQVYRATKTTYAQNQPALAAPPEAARLFTVPSDQDDLNSAALDLVTVLGIAYVARRSEPEDP